MRRDEFDPWSDKRVETLMIESRILRASLRLHRQRGEDNPVVKERARALLLEMEELHSRLWGQV